MKNQHVTFTAILFALTCFGLLPTPKTFAVLPPPDGGYAGQNTAEGQSALLHLSGGTYNTALGWASLGFNVTGNYNTGVGAATLLNNTAAENTATGAGALLSNTVGDSNTAIGAFALFSNTEGNSNTASGGRALFNNITGEANTATGVGALNQNTMGSENTAVGRSALASNSQGSYNTATGVNALSHNTIGGGNSAFGWGALTNTTGEQNTAIGAAALFENTTGQFNTAVGGQALSSNMIGNFNTAIGVSVLLNSTTGGSNTAIGYGALVSNTTGGGNIALGAGAGGNVTTASDIICIGTVGDNVSGSCYIGNIFAATSPGGSAVFINSDGRLGIKISSRRFKEEIRPMDEASEALFALKPVTFRYKKGIDAQGLPQFGLVAEEVEAVNPDLVLRDKEGEPYSVRYDQVNAMLLNEFLKEHKKVEQQGREISKQNTIISELESTVARQQKSFQSKLAEQQNQIEALRSGLQKVSAQLEMMKPVTQMVINEP